MSMKKLKNTTHSLVRTRERFGLTTSQAKKLIRNAYLYGISPDKLEDEILKVKYLNKQNRTRKRIKIYENKVFVFCKNSTKCITIYPFDKKEETNND